MQTSVIRISGMETIEQQEMLKEHLEAMIGVSEVQVDLDTNEVKASFKTPISLNNLEKEIYDQGYQILN
ncbi:heavy-metal-associated domain-containing protein [Staphylococcus simulans]|uniref:putative copper chaperone CsoZ n=1 Tax=Staphylococcus simulans TaxID=1286 RepID=UPI001E45FEA1|nr:heavy metal-associated domain-containing protein [Staphylococcus simulans]MCD8916160.1 heavy-metal-associated domain-containing protein [Staphylococcus simulans]